MKAIAPPRVGVAMCVYNGARFLQVQLDSITEQSTLPLRLAVVDDGSTDGSWRLLQEWARSAPFEVRLHKNEVNLGVVRNFEKSVDLLGPDIDIVLFADQDDRWYPHKVRQFADQFQDDPELGLVHSDADLIDGDGKGLERTLFGALLLTPGERELVGRGDSWAVYAKRNLVTGAACAVRREVLMRALPFSPAFVHDEWIAFTAAIVSRVKILDVPTMAYRLHGGNAVGIPLPNLRWRVGMLLRAFFSPQHNAQAVRAARLEELRKHAVALQAGPAVIATLEAAWEHARFRSQLPTMNGSAGAVLREWRRGRYHAWSSGDISMLHDLFLRT